LNAVFEFALAMALYKAARLTLITTLFASAISASSIPLPIGRNEAPQQTRVLTSYSGRADVKEEWRLPEHIRPIWYSVRLLPYMEEGNFLTEGYVEIFVDCLEDTTNITLNSAVTIIDPSVAVKLRNSKSFFNLKGTSSCQ
jgi:hypothetical protein